MATIFVTLLLESDADKIVSHFVRKQYKISSSGDNLVYKQDGSYMGYLCIFNIFSKGNNNGKSSSCLEFCKFINKELEDIGINFFSIVCVYADGSTAWVGSNIKRIQETKENGPYR